VFWSVFIVAAYQLALLRWSELLCHALLALTLALFALLMVIQRPFFKFSSLAQILFLTIGAMLVFLLLDFSHRGIVLPHLPWHTVLWLQFSVVMGGVLHMVVVRTNALRALKIPLHDHWFGANKTLRGFVVMPLTTAIGAIVPAQVHPAMEQPMWLQAQGVVGWLLLGACLGLAYVIAELPNSFIKRRKGIPPGISPQRARVWFVAADQLDSALGMSLTLALLGFTWIQCMLFMMTCPVTAIIVKQLLFKFKLKQTAL
jgi:CDP-diacylglycerol--serine O-phosphatidyltransferase